MVDTGQPLLDANREIQLETEAADLWFREFIQGNMAVDLETIWQPLEQSVWYLRTILQSNKIRKKFYTPLKDDDTRELIEGVQSGALIGLGKQDIETENTDLIIIKQMIDQPGQLISLPGKTPNLGQ